MRWNVWIMLTLLTFLILDWPWDYVFGGIDKLAVAAIEVDKNPQKGTCDGRQRSGVYCCTYWVSQNLMRFIFSLFDFNCHHLPIRSDLWFWWRTFFFFVWQFPNTSTGYGCKMTTTTVEHHWKGLTYIVGLKKKKTRLNLVRYLWSSWFKEMISEVTCLNGRRSPWFAKRKGYLTWISYRIYHSLLPPENIYIK